ncbi:MAG TPA: DUF4440 domain-containing protein [Longimicrobiales bacterium]|nr:DUF4440 domain-containing protein [Longimicrobiales bacterium]
MTRTLTFTSILWFTAQAGVLAQNIGSVMDRFATYWARADASAIAALASDDGITLNIDSKQMGPLGPRQVTALLRRLFDDSETINVRPLTPQIVRGDPPRAFGELTWTMRPRGTTIPERTTVFVAWILEDDHWRITEIRSAKP